MSDGWHSKEFVCHKCGRRGGGDVWLWRKDLPSCRCGGLPILAHDWYDCEVCERNEREGKGMNCKRCGKNGASAENVYAWKYCPSCGQSYSEQPNPWTVLAGTGNITGPLEQLAERVNAQSERLNVQREMLVGVQERLTKLENERAELYINIAESALCEVEDKFGERLTKQEVALHQNNYEVAAFYHSSKDIWTKLEELETQVSGLTAGCVETMACKKQAQVFRDELERVWRTIENVPTKGTPPDEYQIRVMGNAATPPPIPTVTHPIGTGESVTVHVSADGGPISSYDTPASESAGGQAEGLEKIGICPQCWAEARHVGSGNYHCAKCRIYFFQCDPSSEQWHRDRLKDRHNRQTYVIPEDNNAD